MSEWFDNQKEPNSNLRKLLQELIDKANQCCNLNTEEAKRLDKLEAIQLNLNYQQAFLYNQYFF